jgi:hypothetical protein
MKLLKAIYQAVVQTIKTHRAPVWVDEPVLAVANRATALLTALTGAAAVVNQFSTLVPAKYRDAVLLGLGSFYSVSAVATRVIAKITRSKVFSPATVGHDPATGALIAPTPAP